jgi:hypothetical protein
MQTAIHEMKEEGERTYFPRATPGLLFGVQGLPDAYAMNWMNLALCVFLFQQSGC